MGYSKEIWNQANQELRNRRERRNADRERRRRDCFAKLPRLSEIDLSMIQTGIDLSRIVLEGQDVAAEVNQLSQKHQRLVKERTALLAQLGHPADYLTPPPVCAACEDSGYTDTARCACLDKLLRDIASSKLNSESPLQLCSFDSFKLDYYPNREDQYGINIRDKMAETFTYLKSYADHFSLASRNLFMWGAPGLGKTHLALAIAGTVIEKGYSVIYMPAQNLVSRLEHEHFSAGVAEEVETAFLECDLLIIDDLGTEFSNSFVQAALYNVINSRILSCRPTIISTNLEFAALRERYPDRIISRLTGCFADYCFVGEDIRRKIKEKQV